MKRKRSKGLVTQDYPDKLIDIAKRRVRVHLHELRFVDFSIERLATNIYLQAIHDLATAQANQDRELGDL